MGCNPYFRRVHIKRTVKQVSARAFLLLSFVWAAGRAGAQVTNTPTGVTTTLTTSLGAAYDTAITIGVATIAIGFVVYMVRKGIKPR